MTAYNKLSYLLSIFLLTAGAVIALQPGKPSIGESPDFVFPDFKETILDNGFRYYSIPDNRQPFVALRFLIGIGNDGEKPVQDYSRLACEYFKEILNSKSIESDSKISGAVFSSVTGEEYFTINCLSHSRYSEEIIKILFGALINSKFDRVVFEKIISSEKSKTRTPSIYPEYLAEMLAGRIFRGIRHSYAGNLDEASQINFKEMENFLKSRLTPQNITLSVVGDYKDSLLTKAIKTAVKGWDEDNEVSKLTKSADKLPHGIYFIPRQESIQSYIMFAINAANAESPDYERLNILTDIAGSKLYAQLRETDNLAYSVKGYITSYSVNNYLAFVTSTGTKNTITAINSARALLRKVSETGIDENEIKRAIEYAVNRHYMTFDRKEMIANFIQDGIFSGIPKESIKNYSSYLKSIKPYDINQLAKSYLNPDNMYIIIIGNPAIKNELTKLGEVYEYTPDLYAIEGADSKLEKSGLTPEKLIEKYTDAIGGIESIQSVHTLYDSAVVKMTIGGSELKGQNIVYRQTPDKYYSAMDCGSLSLIMWSDGNRVWVNSNSIIDEIRPEDRQKVYISTKLFSIARLPELGYKCRVLGKSNGMILMEGILASGTKSIFYFDENDYLLRKIETSEPEPYPMRIVELYSDYKETGDLLLPVTTETRTPVYIIIAAHHYFINVQLGLGIEFNPPGD